MSGAETSPLPGADHGYTDVALSAEESPQNPVNIAADDLTYEWIDVFVEESHA